MARMKNKLLDTNDPFPEMSLKLVSGAVLGLPEGFGHGYAVFLLYRGYW